MVGSPDNAMLNKFKKIYYHKLIRDGIATEMHNLGVVFETKMLKSKDFEKALINKLEEEAGGVKNAKSRQELKQELADLLIVIEEVKRLKKISPAELAAAIKANKKRKGGFKNKLWLVWTADDGYKTNEKRGIKS